MYEERLETDKRPKLKKYFRYFLGKLHLAEGNDKEAIRYFQQVLNDPERDDPYQTLLLARVYEGLALASGGTERANYTQRLYAMYPQLVPFTDLTMTFRLNAEAASPMAESILDELRKSRIEFTNNKNVPTVTIAFIPAGEALDIHYSVNLNGFPAHEGVLRVEKNEVAGGGKVLAYRLFGIQKSKTGELPTVPQVVNEGKVKPV
jgi:hypothetical protein